MDPLDSLSFPKAGWEARGLRHGHQGGRKRRHPGFTGITPRETNTAPPEGQSPNLTLLLSSLPWGRGPPAPQSPGGKEEGPQWRLERSSAQGRLPRPSQASLGPSLPLFVSLILFLLSSLIRGMLHLFWARMSQSPAARIPKSKARSSALARTQKEAFSAG